MLSMEDSSCTIQVVSKWLVLGCLIFYENIKNTYHLVIGVYLLWVRRDIC